MKTLHLSIIAIILVISGFVILNDFPSVQARCLTDTHGKVIGTCEAPGYKIAPLKQFKSGISATKVVCNQGFQLILKREDSSPACVKPDTAQKLSESGWTKEIIMMNQTALNKNSNSSRTLTNIIPDLGNDTGIVNWNNQTYYFETPNYTENAFVQGEQILLFHNVIFTLFPSDFAGLPLGGCEGIHYIAYAKFADSTSELLHVFVGSSSCSYDYTPIKLGTHTNPQAGLIFYDGKMKLLVSAEDRSQQNNLVLSLSNQTNETIYHDFPPTSGYSIVNTTQGIVVNDDAEASNLTGFDVQSPTYLPQGYEVKLIKASKEIPMVTIFASKYPLTDKTTSHDFLWTQKGILITYDPTYPFELKNFKQFWTAANKVTIINGSNVAVFDISKQYHDGYQYDMWGTVIAIKDNTTNIAIRGFFNSDDFIKMITSMLEK